LLYGNLNAFVAKYPATFEIVKDNLNRIDGSSDNYGYNMALGANDNYGFTIALRKNEQDVM
jgi:hypothetical protein